MNEHGMYAKVSENYVVLPNNADFSSVKREAADMKSDNKDALATVRYKYGDHVVGCVDLLNQEQRSICRTLMRTADRI